ELEIPKVHRVDHKHVVMDALVVPSRTRAIVAVVLASHDLVTCEPSRVVVDPLLRATRSRGARLAPRHNPTGEFAARDRSALGRQIDKRPVEELDARQ